MNLTLADIERCLTGASEEGHENIAINSVQTDSRAVQSGDLFVCVDGENFDGHEFAAQAAQSGAAGIITSRMLDDPGAPTIMVRDTLNALGRIAACWRDMCGAKLVAVTGTAGKTTVKEMLYTVVSQKFNAAKNYRNFNNQIGLPMSMLKADCDQEIWIMELGISQKGDMEELAPVASPDIAVITNIGPGHLEGLGNEAGVALAKTSLLKFLRQGGSAVVSRDYPLLWDAAREIVDQPVGFSTHARTDQKSTSYVASFLGADAKGMGRFKLQTPEGESEFTAPFCGNHYAENLACVAAVSHQLGITLEEVIAGVQAVEADTQRFCFKGNDKVMVIDDTYNANPLSMAQSIRTAADMAGDRPLVLILGDMRELGAEAQQRHEELGQLIQDVSPHSIFFKGVHCDDVICGFNGDGVIAVNKPEDFLSAWKTMDIDNAVVLIKGSRSLKMEEFVSSLCQLLQADGDAQ